MDKCHSILFTSVLFTFRFTFLSIFNHFDSTIFERNHEFSKNSPGPSLKARALIFWILALSIRILAPVKTEFAISIKIVDFRGGGDKFF